MVCYVPGTGTLAMFGFAVYLVWHRAIMHFLSVAGVAMEVTLLLSTEVAAAIFLIWTARMIRRRRAAAGACTTCRFRCQEALRTRPNFFVNRVDRRVTPPSAVRRAALTCHPAAPLLPLLGVRRPAARHAAAPRAVPASGRRSVALPGRRSLPALSWARIPLLDWRRTPLLNWQGIPLHGSRHALTRPAVALPAAHTPDGSSIPGGSGIAGSSILGGSRIPDGSRAPGETVAFDGYVLTPDGVDAPPDPVTDTRF